MDEVAVWNSKLTADNVAWLATHSLSAMGDAQVPEPGTWLLLGGSLLGLCVGGFRRFVRK